jgi:hypothetical protein
MLNVRRLFRKKIYKPLRERYIFWHSDIIILSFPKSGRTWLRVLMGKALKEHLNCANDLLPTLEAMATASYPSIPNFLVDHGDGTTYARWDSVEVSKAKYKDKKIILLARDPKDVVVSAYFHKTKRKKKAFNLSFSDFLRDDVGSLKTYLAFLNSWTNTKEVSDCLIIRYEEMHSDPVAVLRSIFDFAGVKDISNKSIAAAIEFGQFDNMRKLETSDTLRSDRLRPIDSSDESTYKTRKGEVGGFVDHFSEDDLVYADSLITDLDPIFGY